LRELSDRIDQQLIGRIDQLLDTKDNVVVAIDGNSTAGKSTLAAYFKETHSCDVISMDHFFLRPELRTPQRLSQPGGNIDYDRFIDEVITPLRKGESFSYQPYDCKTGTMAEPIVIDLKPLIVVEGVYSMHPYFFCALNERAVIDSHAGFDERNKIDTYDLTVFLRINEAEQNRRLLLRNPHLHERFVREWVPMENKYFELFQIAGKCDFVFNSDEIFINEESIND